VIVDPLVIAQIALAALQDLLFAAAAGTLACSVIAGRSGLVVPAPLRVWQLVLPLALAITALGYLWLQAAVMSGSPLAEAGAAVGAVLTQSHFGIAWTTGFTGALLATLSRLHPRRGLPLFAIGLVVWAAGKAAASHAADSGDFSVREAIHVVHLCATALWAGSVIVAAVLVRRFARTASDAPVRRAAFCSELSHLATMALVVVLITGIYNVTQDTAQVNASILGTGWGRVLSVKLLCVAVAVALGGWNRMAVLPDLRARAERGDPAYAVAQRHFDTWLLLEAFAMVAVLAIAAVLGHTSPGMGA
jgi:copper resistance protein D